MSARARWWRRSIGGRIVLLSLGLLLTVQLASFVALRTSLSEHAHRVLPNQLKAGERVLQNLLDRRAQTLISGARLLAADYGFREAVSSNDTETIVSVLANHGARIGATETALLSSDFRLRASTDREPHSLQPLVERLAAQAAESGQASALALRAGQPYQAVLVPVKAPVVVGWVLMAFPLDQQLATDLKSLSALDLTLISRPARREPWSVNLTSLDAARAASLAGQPWSDTLDDAAMTSVGVLGEEIGVRDSMLRLGHEGEGGASARALVSLSVDDAVRLPHDLLIALVGITLVAIVVFAFGSVFTARRVTTPLRSLADAAERLGGGDYATPMTGMQRLDEIGELSQSFERMRHSIAANQAQIMKLAYWDTLTGLPNRAQFRDAVQRAIGQARPSDAVVVVMLDLNRFKHVNDALGYHIGDLLLVAVGERLTRQVMRDGDVVARLSGDEFAILLRSGDASLALSVAERIEESFATPYVLEEQPVDIGAAVGVACWPLHADDGDALLNRAEVAMYAAKNRGNGPKVYDPSIELASARTLTLMTELRHAVDACELRLYLQPKLALETGQLIGAEALLRWQHPERGLVPPSHFIPFAEQTGFIHTLTLWVLEEAARHWHALNAEGLPLLISINLSTRDLLDQNLPQKFEALLARRGVAASTFCLEITESAMMDEPQRALATLDRLSAMGFKLSIDDFGTGYSSLAYLKRLPVNELKIDQSFVRNMQTDADDAMIVRSTIDLAHNLGITVVAEGVENGQVWNMLRDLDCDHAQGFHMGQPMPVSELPTWSNRWASATARQGARQRAPALKVAAALAAGVLWAGAAAADPGYYVVTVYSDPGVKTVDLRYWTVQPKGGDLVNWPEVGLAWNVNSRWYTELLASWIGSSSFGTKLSNLEWQNDVLLTQGQYPFDLALHTLWVSPQQSSGDSLEFGPVFQTDIDRTQVNFNVFFERYFGAMSARPTQLKYQWQLRYRWRPQLQFGAQGFGELGPWDDWAPHDLQSHRAGPALFGSIGVGPGTIGWQAAYLVGKTYTMRSQMLSFRVKYDF